MDQIWRTRPALKEIRREKFDFGPVVGLYFASSPFLVRLAGCYFKAEFTVEICRTRNPTKYSVLSMT